MSATERIWNPVEREWLLNVPSRSNVPARTDMPADLRSDTCPFCVGSPEMPTEFEMHVLPSGYPVVGQSESDVQNGSYGHHRVYVYTADHRKRIVDFEVPKVRAILDLIAEETEQMYLDPLVEAVYAFEVFGDHFGPTVDHAHGQIVGLSFTPRRLTPEETCAVCKVDRASIYLDNGLAHAAIPRHARYPFETIVVPARHVGRISELEPEETDALADVLIRVFKGFRTSHGSLPPHILSIVQAPSSDGLRSHVRLELLPLHSVAGRLKRPGGLEVGLGLYTNPLGTDEAVRIMTEAVKEWPSMIP